MTDKSLDKLKLLITRRGLDIETIMQQAEQLTEETLRMADQVIAESQQRREQAPEEEQSGQRSSQEFFVCDLVDYTFRDDQATMEAPVFSLATRSDMKIWRWTSADGRKYIEVAPSAYGRATIHDKDVLIYITSHLVRAFNQKQTPSRTVRFTVYDFLVTTNRPIGGEHYNRLCATLDRLRGTTIKTNIKTGRARITKAFGVIDSWCIVEKSPTDGRMIAVEVTVSEWLYRAIQSREVLSLNRDYFQLRKPLERRLYEVARKHCGHQGLWEVSLEQLREKCGSRDALRNFRGSLRRISDADTLPDYRLLLTNDDRVQFYTRDVQKLAKTLASKSR